MPTLDTIRVKVNNAIKVDKILNINNLTEQLISEFTGIPVKDMDAHPLTSTAHVDLDNSPEDIELTLYYQLYTLFRPLIFDAIEAYEDKHGTVDIIQDR